MPSDSSTSNAVQPLPADKLYTHCDPDLLEFDTTADLPVSDIVVGQSRALDALDFSMRVRNHGYNLFVLGRTGSQRHRIVEEFLARESPERHNARDWCYLNCFSDERKPVAVPLPAGRGTELKHDMERLIDDLKGAIPAVFEGEQHASAIDEINQEFEERIKASLNALQDEAKQNDLSVVSTPHGFAIAPTVNGKLISDEDFERLSEDDQQQRTDAMEALSEKMRRHVEQLPRWHKERRDRIRALHNELVGFSVDQLVTQIKTRYADSPGLVEYFDELREDIIENSGLFAEEGQEMPGNAGASKQAALSRYEVNLLIDRAGNEKPPIVYENNPGIANLLGRIDHIAQYGALITNFTMILPGALHKANGGYLILDAERVLREPLAWDALKRVLASRQIRIESIGQLLSLVSTVTLEPEPIPADLKVILIGERWVYYLLSAYDSEFSELFKVAADFEDRIDRSVENIRQYGQLLAKVTRTEGLLPMTRSAVARTVEHGARIQGDSRKLTTRLRDITDVVCEANYWAERNGATTIDAEHVQKAIDARIARLDRIRSEIQEEIRRSTILIDTDGERIAQINGLAVLAIGDFSFGKPSRITASIRIGDGKIVDIERETELGGPIHSKSVLILTSYLRATYARDVPLSITASLVFEQSYSGVEGDSASIAETCVLLSAIGEIPIRQSLAVTGSVNQHGFAQVIGGVNEKIEGFFDICKARGLTGEQGVLIPHDNVQHLMLREDVVEAAEAGRFHVYPVESVDEAIELLTGIEAGARDENGEFPPGTVNHIVERRLRKLARARQQFDRKRVSTGPRWKRSRSGRRDDDDIGT